MSKTEIESRREGERGAWPRRVRALALSTALPLAFVLPLAPLAIALAIGGAPRSASARDDVPEEIARRKSPVTLEETELRYYKRQFKGKCARCHGRDGDGKGGEPPAPPLVAPADFTDAHYMATRTDGQLFYQILNGGGERCAMPAFGPESDHAWNEEKIWHMVAYVRLFARGSAP
jgi:mono/diheme cytochrome c family protein